MDSTVIPVMPSTAAPATAVPAPSHAGRRLLGALLATATGLLVVAGALVSLLVVVTTAVPPPVSIVLLLADVALLVGLWRWRRAPRRIAAVALGAIVVALAGVAASQAFAATPPIVDAAGQPVAGSIATLEQVTLNGSEQWITIRGHDRTKPVLLYLGIGGPGAGGLPANVTSLAPLEEHFVVVNWDQPGTGKSYGALPIDTLTVDRIVDDARALTELLRARFGQEKIYLMGLSWGTILGTRLVARYPELYRGYVGMGQMVNTTENDRFGYDLAVRVATDRGDARTADALRRNGPPPYDGEGMALKYAAYNNVLFDHMGNARLELILLLVPQLAREYGLADRLNFDRGLIESYTVLYPQLRDLDFTTEARRVEVPMFFLVGRNDVNAVAALVERYYQQLQAPHKEIIWLESGHGASAEEIRDAMLTRVLPMTR
jgi:pimeloyl-ACP methyl ester carboxylesterase